MAISKFCLLFLSRDPVISSLTNHICRPMWGTRLHIWTKISDSWLPTVTCIAGNVTISFKHEYRRPLWHHAVTSSVTSSTLKVFFLWPFLTIFPYLISVRMNISKYLEISTMAVIPIPVKIPTFWAFDWCSSSNINGVMAISNFDLLGYLVT